jgi:small multidrug resistance pump
MALAWAALVGAVICSSGGNALAKWASGQVGTRHMLGLGIAVGFFGLGFILYALAIAGLPLGIAYPALVGGSVSCVALLGLFVLKERISVRRFLGLGLILGGLLLLHMGGETKPQPQAKVGDSIAVSLSVKAG